MTRAHLLCVLLFAVACAGPEEKSQTSAAPPPPAAHAPTRSVALLSLLPGDGTVPGWNRKPDVRTYGVGNLWEFIDGGAEAYLARGFEEVITSEYTTPGRTSGLLLDIYRMNSVANASKIYSQERGPGCIPTRVGAEGCLTPMLLIAWSGPYYVKVTAFEDSDDLQREMVTLAQAATGKMRAGS